MTTPHDRLKSARTAAGYASASAAAARIGVSMGSYGSHENGHRGITADAAERYGAVFGVDASWILFGQGRGPKVDSPAPSIPGFSDGDVAPFRAEQSVQDMAFRIARSSHQIDHPTLWTVKTAYPGLALLAKDVLVADLRATSPATGDIVIVQIIDPDTGEAETRLRRYMPPYLTDGTAGDLTQIDPDHTTIMGTVRATLRLPR